MQMLVFNKSSVQCLNITCVAIATGTAWRVWHYFHITMHITFSCNALNILAKIQYRTMGHHFVYTIPNITMLALQMMHKSQALVNHYLRDPSDVTY